LRQLDDRKPGVNQRTIRIGPSALAVRPAQAYGAERRLHAPGRGAGIEAGEVDKARYPAHRISSIYLAANGGDRKARPG
jgi:hypothetical protein